MYYEMAEQLIPPQVIIVGWPPPALRIASCNSLASLGMLFVRLNLALLCRRVFVGCFLRVMVLCPFFTLRVCFLDLFILLDFLAIYTIS